MQDTSSRVYSCHSIDNEMKKVMGYDERNFARSLPYLSQGTETQRRDQIAVTTITLP